VNRGFATLRFIVCSLVGFAFVTGAVSVWIWTHSTANWRAHLDAAHLAGIELYDALQYGSAPPMGVTIEALTNQDQAHAIAGAFRQVEGATASSRLTIVPISADLTTNGIGAPVTLAILSPDITYSIADLPSRDGEAAAGTTGAVVRKFASFCSDPTVIAKVGDAPWRRVNGSEIWGCDASPKDRRLLAVLLAVLSVGTLITLALNLSIWRSSENNWPAVPLFCQASATTWGRLPPVCACVPLLSKIPTCVRNLKTTSTR